MTQTTADAGRTQWSLFYVGSAFYLAGIGMIIGGFAQWAWMPISWGGFAFGYRAALAAAKGAQ